MTKNGTFLHRALIGGTNPDRDSSRLALSGGFLLWLQAARGGYDVVTSTMKSNAYSVFLRGLLFCILSFFSAGSLIAGGTIGVGGVSATYTWDGSTLVVTGTFSNSYPGSGAGDGVGFNTQHGGVESAPFHNLPNGTNGPISFSLNPFVDGDKLNIVVFSTDNGSVATYERSRNQLTLTLDGDPTYGATIQIPANPTINRILYVVKQDGEVKGSFVQEAGAASSTLYMGNLPNNHALTIEQVTGGDVNVPVGPDGKPDYSGGVNVTENTTTVSVGGALPSAESSPGHGATANSGPVTGPTPVGPGVPPPSTPTTTNPDAPSPSPTPTPPSGPPHVDGPPTPTNPTPEGDTATTKADSMRAANQITDAIHGASTKAVETGNNVVDAIHTSTLAEVDGVGKTIMSIDKVSTTVHEGTVKNVEALNKVQASQDKANGYFDSMNKSLTAIGTKLDTANTKLEQANQNTTAIKDKLTEISGKMGPSYTDAQTAATAVNAEAVTQGNAAKGAIAALMPTAPANLGYEITAEGDGDFMKITMPASFGGATVDFNPFSPGRMGGLASWFRSAIAWVVLMTLAYMIFQETKQFFIAASAAQQAKGNTIAAGTGGQATSLLAAGLITAAFVTLVTALMGFTFGEITIPNLIANMTVNPTTSAPAHMMWFLDQFLPLATIITAFVARVAFPVYGQAVYAVFVTAVRFIVP